MGLVVDEKLPYSRCRGSLSTHYFFDIQISRESFNFRLTFIIGQLDAVLPRAMRAEFLEYQGIFSDVCFFIITLEW